jgi:DNA invertase Pin-like site-specific DNA recombinase
VKDISLRLLIRWTCGEDVRWPDDKQLALLMVVPGFDVEAGSVRPLRRAAQYVRMSTEHQKYSTENQAQIIEEYALRRGLEVVRTYADAGKSGLRLDGRDSLQQLLADVQSGAADFTDILVYDVSRWGRFQDADQSAYYEYVCRSSGVAVHYCAEQFENDGTIGSSIIKTVKRAMAGEYSRELSAKAVLLGLASGASSSTNIDRLRPN